jgi:hypothetical protein
MKAIRKWYKLALAAGVLISCNTVIAQSSYKVTDLGALHNGVIGCAMGLNNRGWTESMDGYLDSSGTFIGRAAMNLDGHSSSTWARWEDQTVGSIGEESMSKARQWAWPKAPSSTQTAKTSARSAQNSPADHFFGKTES